MSINISIWHNGLTSQRCFLVLHTAGFLFYQNIPHGRDILIAIIPTHLKVIASKRNSRVTAYASKRRDHQHVIRNDTDSRFNGTWTHHVKTLFVAQMLQWSLRTHYLFPNISTQWCWQVYYCSVENIECSELAVRLIVINLSSSLTFIPRQIWVKGVFQKFGSLVCW